MGGAETSPGISVPGPRPPMPPRTEYRRVVRPVPDPPPPSGLILDRVRAWMVVVPLDLFLLLLPLSWATGHSKAVIAMAALSVVLLHSGGRHWARLHLSVLDDLPHLLGKLFVATALVATVI